MNRLLMAGRAAVLATLLFSPGVASAPREISSFKIGKHTSVTVAEVAISPDSKQVAALVRGSGSIEDEQDDHIRIWDLKTKKEVARIRPRWKGGWRGQLFQFTPDGKWLIASCNQEVYVFDLKGKKLARTFKPKTVAPLYAALTPDGKTVACAADRVGLYDLATGKELAVMKSPPDARRVVVSRDGSTLAVAHQKGRISLFDLKKRKPLFDYTAWQDTRGYCELALSPDGKKLVAQTGNSFLQLTDLKTREDVVSLNFLDKKLKVGHSSCGMAFTPDGKRLVTAGRGTGAGVFLWEPATGKVEGDRVNRSTSLSAVALSRDGKTLVVGYKTVIVYDVRDKKTDPEP
jgi:WD40 repeat protein